jgi:hypothetical protein
MALEVFSSTASATQLNSIARQVVITCTSSTRPSSPDEGMCIYETDTDRVLVWDASAWRIVREPSQSWTPAVTQSVAVTCTVTRAMYHRFGPVVYASCDLAITGSGTTANAIAVSLPVAAADANDVHGQFVIVDASAANYAGSIYPSSTTAVTFVCDAQTSLVGAAPAFGLASGDRVRFDVTYRYF